MNAFYGTSENVHRFHLLVKTLKARGENIHKVPSMDHFTVLLALQKGLEQSYPRANLERSPRMASTKTADLVLRLPKERIAFEIKISNFYDGLGRAVLWAEEFDASYLVVPKELLPSQEILRRIPRDVGVAAFQVRNHTIKFETVKKCRTQLAGPSFEVALEKTPQLPRTVKTSLVSPKALRVIRYLISHRSTTQIEIARGTDVSVGMVNKLISALVDRELVSYKGKRLVVFDVWRLLNEVSWNRPVKGLKKGELRVDSSSTRETEQQIARICGEAGMRYAMTLFSGASRYIGYGMKYDSVQTYVEEPERLLDSLRPKRAAPGDGILLDVFGPDTWDILDEAQVVAGVAVCSTTQLVMDLVSYGHVGRDWAVKLYEETIAGRNRR